MSDAVAPRRDEDEEALSLEIGPYLVSVATSFGPRVLGFRLTGGPDLFARLGDDVVIDRADSGIYRFRGGHRLWAAPEIPSVTYAPDNDPCQVISTGDAVTITGPVDRAGLIKTIVVGLDDQGGAVVDHTLTNAGGAPLPVAPWAITQLRLGGVALIPVGGAAESNGLEADRSLILWPYTDLSDPRLTWRERALVASSSGGPPFKIGTGPQPGRLGYLIDHHLFTKEIPPAGTGDYPDRGAVAQLYLNDIFCELESAGPIKMLEPGSHVSHRELWMIEECADLETAWHRMTDEKE